MPAWKPETDGKNEAPELPIGVKLVHTLEGHRTSITSLAFDPLGYTLASGSVDGSVFLWDFPSGELRNRLNGYHWIHSLAFDPDGRTLVSGNEGGTVRLWEPGSGNLRRKSRTNGPVFCIAWAGDGKMFATANQADVRIWEREGNLVRTLTHPSCAGFGVSWHPHGTMLATGSADKTVNIWSDNGRFIHALEGHTDVVGTVAFSPGGMLASGSDDKTVRLWEPRTGKLLRTLEGHTGKVQTIAFSPDGALLASKSRDQTVRLWRCDTWELVAVIPGLAPFCRATAIAFHPTEPLLVTNGTLADSPSEQCARCIRLWKLDYSMLFGRATTAAYSLHHTTARIILVGDSGVGKTGLGWRLAHGDFVEHASTHGQQFWVCDVLGTKRADGTECEAVVWDLAGQPDYRLVHSLFLDDADLALVVFDPTNARDPLHGVEFWLKQLGGPRAIVSGAGAAPDRASHSKCQTVLVAARCDRGDSRLTQEELKAFCHSRGIASYLRTSAHNGEGIDDLVSLIKTLINWENKSATTTSVTFKRIKDYVLGIKETSVDGRVIVSADELRLRLEETDTAWRFTDDELRTAIGHLETYGYVRRLRTSRGEQRILLRPELLNNLAASFVLEARRNPKGLGALEEQWLIGNDERRYDFPELTSLIAEEQTILTDAATLLFLEHHVCFRETDPLTGQSFLIFPELINLKRPVDEDKASVEGVAYSVSGAVENVFASLVVLLGYTSTFTRIAQWQSNARYEVADGSVLGFKLTAEDEGELDLTLCFSPGTLRPVQMLFQGLFESCLARRNLNVQRYEPVSCSKCHRQLSRAVLRQWLQERNTYTFCNGCGEKLSLSSAEAIQQTTSEHERVERQRRQADARTRFEQVIFRVQAYVKEQGIKPPQCFISYAWGEKEHERWVEKSLATDLHKAGIDVVLDRWENARIGASIVRFVDRIAMADYVVVVGTLAYLTKYNNTKPDCGYIVAAEGHLVGGRLLGSEAKKQTVLPTLLDGTPETALPPLLNERVYADFRNDEYYFTGVFHLILTLYGLAARHPAVADLVESLQPDRRRT